MDKKLTFYVFKNGEQIECTILAHIRGEANNISYVAFNDGLDTDVQYAKIIKNGNQYMIDEFDNLGIVEQLKNMIIDEINKDTFTYLENNYE